MVEQVNKFCEDFKPTKHQKEQLDEYAYLLNEYNKVMNLTGIDEYGAVYEKHFYDSLTIQKFINKIEGKKIADLGTGAGFPGIVLAIFNPEKEIYLIEPLKKRCNFLEIVINKLHLNNVVILNKRIEEVNEKFDVIVSRAVAKLNILLELAIPFIKKNGFFIALKGSNGYEEIKLSQNAIKELFVKILEIDEVELPFEKSKRINILFKKEKDNNKYPRNFGQIKKKPL